MARERNSLAVPEDLVAVDLDLDAPGLARAVPFPSFRTARPPSPYSSTPGRLPLRRRWLWLVLAVIAWRWLAAGPSNPERTEPAAPPAASAPGASAPALDDAWPREPQDQIERRRLAREADRLGIRPFAPRPAPMSSSVGAGESETNWRNADGRTQTPTP